MSAVETLKAYRTIHNADNVDDAIAEIQRCYERIDELGGEIDRLRADLEIRREGLRELNTANHELIEANQTLWADNAELREALRKFVTEGLLRAEANAILAKTAKDDIPVKLDPASDSEAS